MFISIKHLTVVSRHSKALCLFSSSLTTNSSLRNNFASPAHQTLHHLLEKCQSMRKLKPIHAQIILHGLHQETLTISKLISFSAVSETGDLQYAQLVFDHLPQPNRYMYNSLIRGYVNSDNPIKALHLYNQMIRVGISPNEFTYPFVLKVCAVLSRLSDGVLVHAQIIKLGFEFHIYVQNGLISVYCSCGAIRDSRKVFDDMDNKSLVSWNTMIGGYSKIGYCSEAFLLFRKMRDLYVEPDDFTFVNLLSVCSHGVLGRSLHSYIVTTKSHVDIYVQNAILDMYAKCGDLNSAQTFFDRMRNKNVVSWTSMVTAYSKHGLLESAKNLFDQMPVKNVVSWNSMFSGYLQKGCYSEVLGLFVDILNTGLTPDESTMVSVLSACSQLGDLEKGKKIHAYISSNYIAPSVTLLNLLIDMYAKCGVLETSLSIFSKMPEKNLVSWNVMIGALALHGHGFEAVKLFEVMESGNNGIHPDEITFMGLLSACCHSGLTEIGQHYFEQMIPKYNVPHEIEHYACMIDLYGRVGLFGDAIKQIKQMPMKPDVVVWGALLGACRIHKNIEIGKQVLKQVLELEPYTSGLYVLVSNMFCECKRWQDVKNVRKLMKDHGIKKVKGVSFIEVNGELYEFMVDDHRNELSNDVYELLNQLTDHLKSLGKW